MKPRSWRIRSLATLLFFGALVGAVPPPHDSRSGVQGGSPPLPIHEIARRAQGWSAAISRGRHYGAGILVTEDGHVLTNHHVVKGSGPVTVHFFDGGPYEARVLETDEALDLALLKVDMMHEAAPLASVLEARVGDDVLSVGSPRKMRFSVARGMISYVGRPLRGLLYLQTDLPINGGSSGGPVVDGEGRVIGVMSFVMRDSEGISFALPIDYALKRFAAHLSPRGDQGARFDAWIEARSR